MKNLQKFSKFLIYFCVFLLPIIWYILVSNKLMGKDFLGQTISNNLWDISFLSVLFVMAIRPLADLFPKLKTLRKLVFLRKSLGILSASIVVLALITKWIQNPFTFTGYFDLNNWKLYYPIISRVSEITAVILLATSNIFSMKKLGKNWKKIQKTSYLYFFSGGMVATRWENGFFIYTSMVIVIILYILVMIKKYNLKKLKG